MTPERWQHIRPILDRALELRVEERTAFLQEACSGDPGLKADIEALLRAEARKGLPLEGAVEEYADALLAEIADGDVTAEQVIGRQVGPYRLVREVGRGGMGAVYLAERVDGHFEQRVALKLLPPGLDSAEREHRLRSERQILAALDHPNIARLLDGGVTAEGLPFLAMEYVDGIPIHRYCDEHGLEIEQRLALFLRVCEAVHYAHRNLVVHRDLKPANILVTAAGQVKLLDFGIARLLDPESGVPEGPPTHTGLRPMTPEYASPEQVRGEPITTASDVYQLGVLLFELLTGQRPYRVDARSQADVERVICTEPPPRPSAVARSAVLGGGKAVRPRRITPGRLRKALRDDLDAIVLMALRKEPERRFTSVQALADDVERHLSGRPVLALVGARGYRARTFIRRHRWSIGVAAAFALVLAGYAVTITVQANRTREALAHAQLETQKADQVTEFLISLFQASDPHGAAGDTMNSYELLERGTAHVAHLTAQPEVQAEMFEAMGSVYHRMGEYKRAQLLHERALAIREEVLGEAHIDLAASLYYVGELALAQGNYDGAADLLERSLAMRRTLLGERDSTVIFSINKVARLYEEQADYKAAEPLYRRALESGRRELGEGHNAVIAAMQGLASVLAKMAKFGEAETLFRRVIAITREVFGDEHPAVASGLNNLALLQMDRGNYDEAEVLLRDASATKRKAMGERHPGVATEMHNLGIVLGRKGEYAEAESLLVSAIAINANLLGDEHPKVALNRLELAQVVYGRGDYEEARRLYGDVLQQFRRLLGDEHRHVATALIGEARVLMATQRPGQAERLLREALAIREELLTANHWRTAQARSLLGACLTALSRYEEAEPLLVNSYRQLEDRRGIDHPLTIEALDAVISFYEATGKRAEAAAYGARREMAAASPQ